MTRLRRGEALVYGEDAFMFPFEVSNTLVLTANANMGGREGVGEP